ncbi:type IV pilin [Halobacteriales archaeon QS_1_68_20]|nr:MAG: type IV pilin [Halobacteriales archaeon QS_1_68_20]
MKKSPTPTRSRAVSTVIGVILMVAVTVVLAAAVGTYVLDLGDDVRTNPQASVSFEEDGNDVTIQVKAVQRADAIDVSGDCGTAPLAPEAGARATVTCSPGDTIVVTATYNNHEVQLQEYEFEG